MADVTDVAFREIIARCKKPDVFYTEFVACDGLCSEGREKLLMDLLYTEYQRPIVAQLFGAHPENFFACAKLVRSLGFDGIDINMGCPDKSVMKQGAGAALIRSPKLAQEIIRATQQGADGLPVSIKTRLGMNAVVLDEWLPVLLETQPAAIAIHARTAKERSRVPAHWDLLEKAVQIRDALSSSTLILGNGDVNTLSSARERAAEFGVDGVMLGRGIFGNPWLFDGQKDHITMQEKLSMLLVHTELFVNFFGTRKNFAIMKKHYQAYVAGWSGAKALRTKLMSANSLEEVRDILSVMKNI